MADQIISHAERVVFEANADGVKILTLGRFDSDLYIGFQQNTVGREDSDARVHVEINDQMRSAYVEEIAVSIADWLLKLEYKGDAEDHLKTPQKLIRVGISKSAGLEAIAAIQIFFSEFLVRS